MVEVGEAKSRGAGGQWSPRLCSADPALALLHSDFIFHEHILLPKTTGAHPRAGTRARTELYNPASVQFVKEVTPHAVTVSAHMGRARAEIQVQQGIYIKTAGVYEQPQIQLGSSLFDNTGVSHREREQNEKRKLDNLGLLPASEVSEERIRRQRSERGRCHGGPEPCAFLCAPISSPHINQIRGEVRSSAGLGTADSCPNKQGLRDTGRRGQAGFPGTEMWLWVSWFFAVRDGSEGASTGLNQALTIQVNSRVTGPITCTL